jgi:hypothetical protein
MNEDQLWDIRVFVYQHLAETTRPPRVYETAKRFALKHEQVASAYEALHQRHAFFLNPGTHEILIANPFSGVETSFQAHANGRTYFANCAWDSLGIPAALHVDAQIEAKCAQSGEQIHITVTGGEVSPERSRSVQYEEGLVHFLVPFTNWYDDLPFT